jgi:hypothetical protein
MQTVIPRNHFPLHNDRHRTPPPENEKNLPRVHFFIFKPKKFVYCALYVNSLEVVV